MKKTFGVLAGAVLMALFISGCSTSNVDCSYEGVQVTNGTPIAHVYTTNSSWTFVGVYPLIGDATLKKTFEDFKKETKRLGGTKVNVVSTNKETHWFGLPPISWIFPMVESSVSGDVYP